MAIKDAITAAVKGSSRIEARGFAVRFLTPEHSLGNDFLCKGKQQMPRQ